MTVALISDIHANLTALEAVLTDIADQGVGTIYCLGDVVGYGPQPVECMQWLMEMVPRDKIIAGNHDQAVIFEPVGFHRSARQAALWTKSVVQPRWYDWWNGRQRRWQWLSALPIAFSEDDGDVLFVHASPRHPLEEYILEELTRDISLTGEDPRRMLEENFARIKHTCFIGHTHRPGLITGDDFRWYSLAEMDCHWSIDGRKTIINIGSVGQPRDGDPRASYVLFDGKEVRWRRVEYDVEATRKLMMANPLLEQRLADRLLEGK